MRLSKNNPVVIKVFVCWQSDVALHNRQLIINALNVLDSRLKESYNCCLFKVEDITGYSGMVSVADVVFRNILDSDIFICDLTPVSSHKTYDRRKAMPNSNVLVELGFAMCCHDLDRIFPVANLKQGKWNYGELPFDIFNRKIYSIGKYDIEPAFEDKLLSTIVKLIPEKRQKLSGFLNWWNRFLDSFSSSMSTNSSINYCSHFENFVEGNKDSANTIRDIFEEYSESSR